MDRGFRLAKIFGIDINIDTSWIFIFLLVTWNLAIGVFPLLHPDWGLLMTWTVAIIASLLFFVSVLAHELAHSIVARSRGLPVNTITLFVLGGVSNLEKEPQSPITEFLMAVVGPVTSIVLGISFLFLGSAISGSAFNFFTGSVGMLSRLSPLSTLLIWLGSVNILVGLFNLVPGFPLDGGRILRSIIWKVTNSLTQATRIASGVGQLVAWTFILIGISMILGINVPIFGSGIVGGIWLIFIGWFLNGAAVRSYEQVFVEDIFEDISVKELMRTEVSSVSPSVSVKQLVDMYIMGSDSHAFPVMSDGNLEGLITLEDVKKVSSDAWDEQKVGQLMTPIEELDTVNPKENVANALRKMMSRDVGQVPVVEGNKLIGMLNRRDILLWMMLHMKDSKISKE